MRRHLEPRTAAWVATCSEIDRAGRVARAGNVLTIVSDVIVKRLMPTPVPKRAPWRVPFLQARLPGCRWHICPVAGFPAAGHSSRLDGTRWCSILRTPRTMLALWTGLPRRRTNAAWTRACNPPARSNAGPGRTATRRTVETAGWRRPGAIRQLPPQRGDGRIWIDPRGRDLSRRSAGAAWSTMARPRSPSRRRRAAIRAASCRCRARSSARHDYKALEVRSRPSGWRTGME